MRARAKGKRKTLFVDIETLPRLGYYFDDNKPYNILKQIEDTVICCVVAKWLDGKSVTLALADFKGYKPGSRDDKQLCLALWKLMDEAEIVVAHNGDRFDVKKINARFIHHKMKPYSPIRTIDTYKQAKAIGGFDKNRLDYLGQFLGCGRKLETGGKELWFACLDGDEKAWRRMKRYNAQDVRLLEAIYRELLPWMKNPASTSEGTECPRCRSLNLKARGFARNRTARYQRFQCDDCGGWCRESTAQRDEKRYVAA
jgi:hypothetical protein